MPSDLTTANLPAPRVVAVVVTWNRRALLTESVDAIRAQTLAPVAIVVVDNASTDDTARLLDSAYGESLDVVHLLENTGGAGGFTVGVERALCHAPDLIWLLDDDTVPTPTAAAELVAAWQNYPSQETGGARPAVLASRVVWTDGRDHPMNTPRTKPGVTAEERTRAAAVGAIPIRSASFVSIMCDADVVRERGLPVADYFLWNDDFEYSTRLIRDGVGLACPSSVVEHKTKVFGSTDVDPGERFYFEVRNKLWVFSRSAGLSVPERGLYAAATARRWARTFQASSDRRTLRSAMARGLVAGLRRPRPNADVLAPARPAPAEGVSGEPFTLLISTYGRDDPGYLREAFLSSTERQTRPPAEVVLVQDGPVPDLLAAEIEHLVATSAIPVVHLPLVDNIGLGPALDAGLAASSHEIVARMDADDISRPDRFARQVPVIEAGADIVGSGLVEFGESISDVVGTRTPPTDPAEIRRVIRFRDPFNHPTVVYRRSAVLAAGGYTDMALLEDYLLFTRMVEGGAVPANLAEPLVYYRVGAGAYARRGGSDLLRSEIRLQRRFRQLGITSRAEFARNVAVRGGYRLVPEGVRKVAYRRLLANRSDAVRR
ncbi:MAG: glycosyltransferase [Propionibacteriales bacterium]|nr:glycosyltransferase [Propionibacteriales bacterium]